MTEQDALQVLNAVPGMGALHIRRLMKHFGSAIDILKTGQKDLLASNLLSYLAVKNIINFSKDKFLQDEYNLRQCKGVTLITIADKAYPNSLKDFEDAPVVLYIKGDVATLSQMSVALVGSRAASYYGCKTANIFAKSFVQAGLIVVSGLARGIDTAAHQGSLEANGKTIAVIGCGFNHMYPKENQLLMETIAQNGAVVSEFSFDTLPLKQNFPWRNRIISGLAQATVVIEAGSKSGALITADYALSQNKNVFVVPSNIDSDTALGSNQLIRDGAQVALSPDDVLAEIKEGYVPLHAVDNRDDVLLSDEEAQGFCHITHVPMHLDELSRQSGLSISRLMNITLSLELKRAIRQLPGQYYVRNEHA